MLLFYQSEVAQGVTWLPEEESRHCIKVLRKRPGDSIMLTDGVGYFYECLITKDNPIRCEFSVIKKNKENTRPYHIHIGIAATKNQDRIEWFVEKATELGIDEITILECDHSERSFLKMERLQKVAISAMKQSQKATLPILHSLTAFKDMLSISCDQKFIAFVDYSNPDHLLHLAEINKKYLILIGPEGDFSQEELTLAIQHDFVKVSLGPSRLRTETAGISACCTFHIRNS